MAGYYRLSVCVVIGLDRFMAKNYDNPADGPEDMDVDEAPIYHQDDATGLPVPDSDGDWMSVPDGVHRQLHESSEKVMYSRGREDSVVRELQSMQLTIDLKNGEPSVRASRRALPDTRKEAAGRTTNTGG